MNATPRTVAEEGVRGAGAKLAEMELLKTGTLEGHFRMASSILRITGYEEFVTRVFLARNSGQAIAHVMQRLTD